MNKDQQYFLLLNIGHFLDHLFTLIFATVAALALIQEWNIGYAALLVYATPGFFAFGLFSLPAGWLADKWSRDGMMTVFFIGIGSASILAGYVETPLQMGICLFIIGVFAAIYHPVGLAIVTLKWRNTGMRIATNGVWGNLGVASAALIAGYLIDNGGWRMAFILPGVFSVGVGLVYLALRWGTINEDHKTKQVTDKKPQSTATSGHRSLLFRVAGIVFLTTAVSSVIFQSTTFALPKIFDERLQNLASDITVWANGIAGTEQGDVATVIGLLAFTVFAVASIAQIIVGRSLDLYGPRVVFLGVACLQILFFSLMPGLHDGLALAAAFGFMLGAFGQIPINDFMIAKTASGANRARIYGIRYVVSFSVLAVALPLISYVYQNWGFDTLFRILAGAAFVILVTVAMLPKRLPEPASNAGAAE